MHSFKNLQSIKTSTFCSFTTPELGGHQKELIGREFRKKKQKSILKRVPLILFHRINLCNSLSLVMITDLGGFERGFDKFMERSRSPSENGCMLQPGLGLP